jgi:hypothetical protein
MVAGMAIYPDDRQMEVELSGSPQPIGGVGAITDPISAFVFPPADLFAIRTVHPHWVVVPRQPKLVLRPPNLNSSSEDSSHLLPLWQPTIRAERLSIGRQCVRLLLRRSPSTANAGRCDEPPAPIGPGGRTAPTLISRRPPAMANKGCQFTLAADFRLRVSDLFAPTVNVHDAPRVEFTIADAQRNLSLTGCYHSDADLCPGSKLTKGRRCPHSGGFFSFKPELLEGSAVVAISHQAQGG